VVFAALFLSACSGPSPDAGAAPAALAADSAQADSLENEVLAEVERYYEDFSRRDWTAYATHFWPGAMLATVWQPPGQPTPRMTVVTVPEFVAQAPLGPDSKPIFEERMTSARVRVHRNLATVWADYTARFGDSTRVRTWRGVDAFTLMKHDGRWRILSLGYTDRE
jgi:hypothetical protein